MSGGVGEGAECVGVLRRRRDAIVQYLTSAMIADLCFAGRVPPYIDDLRAH